MSKVVTPKGVTDLGQNWALGTEFEAMEPVILPA